MCFISMLLAYQVSDTEGVSFQLDQLDVLELRRVEEAISLAPAADPSCSIVCD